MLAGRAMDEARPTRRCKQRNTSQIPARVSTRFGATIAFATAVSEKSRPDQEGLRIRPVFTANRNWDSR
jgi:hypothetical protein